MDRETHLILAGMLLESCDLPAGGRIYSVLPTVDIEPLVFHRQYAHPIANQPLILDGALEIYGMEEFRERDLKEKAGQKLAVLEEERKRVEGKDAIRDEKRTAKARLKLRETARGGG